MLRLKQAASSTLAITHALHRVLLMNMMLTHITEFSETTGVVTSLNSELVVQIANFI